MTKPTLPPRKRYEVALSRATHDFESVWIEVEARTPEAAQRLALWQSRNDNGELWGNAKTFVGDTDQPEVDEVKDITPEPRSNP